MLSLTGFADTARAPETTHPFARLRQEHEGLIDMSEEAQKARQALQESMDLRDQGHSDD